MWTSTCGWSDFISISNEANEYTIRMGYIEEQMRLRRRNGKNEEETQSKNLDPREELYMITSSRKDKTSEEGNVTNSAKMLTAIPEVDLGME
jgi:hypothetical protein